MAQYQQLRSEAEKIPSHKKAAPGWERAPRLLGCSGSVPDTLAIIIRCIVDVMHFQDRF